MTPTGGRVRPNEVLRVLTGHPDSTEGMGTIRETAPVDLDATTRRLTHDGVQERLGWT